MPTVIEWLNSKWQTLDMISFRVENAWNYYTDYMTELYDRLHKTITKEWILHDSPHVTYFELIKTESITVIVKS